MMKKGTQTPESRLWQEIWYFILAVGSNRVDNLCSEETSQETLKIKSVEKFLSLYKMKVDANMFKFYEIKSWSKDRLLDGYKALI